MPGKCGLDCSYTCHCDAADCIDVTGCSGSCQEGWSGPTCTKENVALRKTTYQSSYYPKFTHVAVLAVNGDRRAGGGGFCIITGVNQPYTWWEVDLGRDYYIHKLDIYFRTDYTGHRNGVYIYSSTEANQTNTGHLCGATTINSPDIITVTCDHTARYITLYRNTSNIIGGSIMDFCEVEVYICDPGTFGDDCSQFCYCRSGPCNYTTGECAGGCKPNWAGTKCDGCDSSHYGVLCRKQCSSRHCDETTNISSCDVHGSCDNGCAPGWKGTDCLEKCSDGQYGKVCEKSCVQRNCLDRSSSCDHVTGECAGGCNRGYRSVDCTESCSVGTYSYNCNTSCDGRHCSGNQDCDKFFGNCTQGCLSGWELTDCVVRCRDGRYGPGCKFSCSERHCKGDSTSCDADQGTCLNGCQPGWKNQSCSVACATGTYGPDCRLSCSQRHCQDEGASCDHINGSCGGPCQGDWKEIDCTGCTGAYGLGCSSSCSDRHCKPDDAPCDHLTGSCGGPCDAGWQGDTCTDKCDSGKYGDNCAMFCAIRNCINKDVCPRADGECIDGCVSRFEGLDCLRAQAVTGNSDSAIIALAVIAGVLLVLLIIVTSLFIWYIKHHGTKSDFYQQEMRKTNTNPPSPPTDPSAVEYEIVDRQDGGHNSPRAFSSQQVDTSHSANYGNSSTSRDQMGAQPRHSESGCGYVNAGQTNEYEKLDLSNPPQNDYDRITGV
ncbi:multiple epidermal growth factor-like domains protein 10 isoform X2 [Gigantopelta aegis]|uniref:multiple epidermal growth factor-like domains protein 10 isoform X2 n=1 Tax=Gigantopelta aegis TaxID=1735272 RepID=UPI001B88D0C9|nr:multiple epidermal growth factor-like domains protein 10 isoform X2 [Gigantopelta aegis]